MASVKYSYSILHDFPNQKVAMSKLKNEIKNSTIVTALDYANFSDAYCDIWFKASLASSEQDTLDDVVANHDGVPDPDTQVLPITEDNRLKVQIHKPTGAQLTIISHNFTDPTTWYGDSVRTQNEELDNPLGDGVLYRSNHKHWIDLHHGKITRENEIIENNTDFANGPFYPVITVNGEEKVEGRDYIINYDAGEVLFNWVSPFVTHWREVQGASCCLGMGPLAPTDVVRGAYNYANGSTFYVRPPSGKVLRINRVECQFTQDLYVDTDLCFSVYAYAPPELGLPLGTKIPVPGEIKYYKGAKDYINEGNEGTGSIVPYGGGLRTVGNTQRGVRHPVSIFPFDYQTSLNIASNLGVEIRIFLVHDQPYNGEWATVTFYSEMEDL